MGKARPIASKTGETGIYKEPAGAVEITPDGLAGDAICDTENHGGVDQAVYVYGEGDYAWWAAELDREMEPGMFSENLTVSELESADYAIGDRFHIQTSEGEVILEVTAPRIPCGTFARRMGDPTFVKRFRHAERPGLYCRVLAPGTVQPGDAVTVERYVEWNDGEPITAREMFRDFYEPKLDEATLRRHLSAPIAIRDREAKEAELAKRVGGIINCSLRRSASSCRPGALCPRGICKGFSLAAGRRRSVALAIPTQERGNEQFELRITYSRFRIYLCLKN